MKHTFATFQMWQRREYLRINSQGSIVDTAVGPVEYQEIGKGPAVIYAHGTPGGYDQGIAFADFISNYQCRFLSPSRPGYLRTPLTSGASPSEQADMYAALLDTLGIETASIIGFSGGGPSALQFALRYPERCRGLAMIGGVVQRRDKHELAQVLSARQRFFLEIVERLLVSDPFLYSLLPFTRLLPKGKAVAGMLSSGTLYYLRKAGYENDVAQFAAIQEQEYPLEQITAPTLVVHGTQDEDVSFDDATLLMRKLPRVMVLALAGGDHAAFYTYAKTIMPILGEFLLA